MSGKHQDELESQKNKHQEEITTVNKKHHKMSDRQLENFEEEKRVLEKNAAKTM